MGMYFNTLATTEMNGKVNNQFNSGNIDFWKSPTNRALFGKIGQGGASLSYIAGQNGIFPNAGFNSPIGKKWFKWLDDLEATGTTAMRGHFFEHLDPNNKCVEIIFLVGPKQDLPISVKATKIPNSDGTYSLRVNIDTPTAAVVRAAIKKKMKARKGNKKAKM
ncbi:MAG: hypothetical protein ACHQK9_03715 [Reyranellales bacterium]